MPERRSPVISVIGEGDCSDELYEMARTVGRLVAERGAIVATGGLGGVMEAASRGAREAGGTTIGILPGADRAAANPFVTISLPTGLGEARNVLVVRVADAVIAVGGKYGTLSEIALALKLGKPLVGLKTWGLIQQGREVEAFHSRETPEDALSLAFRLMDAV